VSPRTRLSLTSARSSNGKRLAGNTTIEKRPVSAALVLLAARASAPPEVSRAASAPTPARSWMNQGCHTCVAKSRSLNTSPWLEWLPSSRRIQRPSSDTVPA
jgi:hypothetical protein